MAEIICKLQTLLFPVYRRIRCKIEIPESRKNTGIACHIRIRMLTWEFLKTPSTLRHSAVPVNFDPVPSFCCVFLFLTRCFRSFDFGVIPVFVLNVPFSNFGGKMTTNRIYNCEQWTATTCFPFHCSLEGGFGLWHMHHTNFNSLYMWFLYICVIPVFFNFTSNLHGNWNGVAVYRN